MPMAIYKDNERGTWYSSFHYTDWQGVNRRKLKRGFQTKKEAQEWERRFRDRQSDEPNMLFSDFVELFYEDRRTRLRLNTYTNRKYLIDSQILPYFKDKRINQISASDVRKWQNMLLQKGYKDTYLRGIHSQLSAIFNFAVQYYNLKNNPCRAAGAIGKSRADEVEFWTQEEFEQFLLSMQDDWTCHICFLILYWTGMRIGELLALYPEVIDFEKRTITVKRSYQRIHGEDVITEPKTERGKRVISIPPFLAEEINCYIASIYGIGEKDRIFPFTKGLLECAFKKGISQSGVKRIKIHALRHSHASLCVKLGFSPLEIAKRLGHEKIETTMNTYSHLYPDSQSIIADRLEEVFKEGTHESK